jgi:hypothetical protein
MLIGFCIAGIGVAAVVWLNLKDIAVSRDGDWHYCGSGMRRWVDGKWQYRPRTDDEEDEYRDRLAW